MQLLLAADDSETDLLSELLQTFPDAPIQRVHSLLFELDLEKLPAPRFPHVAFARQWFPGARLLHAESIKAWAELLFLSIANIVPDDRPWRLHVEPHYGARAVQRMGARAWHSAKRGGSESKPVQGEFVNEAQAGRQRCRIIREELIGLLRKKRRSLLRSLCEEPLPFTRETSLVQLLLIAPDRGFISVAMVPFPFEQRHLISAFPKGHLEIPSDRNAPSRAFGKLLEAQLRMGCSIQPGETCLDLGASPGSWTYAAVNQGGTVIAVDRSTLREDLMSHPSVQFRAGDAFRFRPDRPVDWLLCDVIAEPDRSVGLLRDWLQRDWCRNFVVTIKLRDDTTARTLNMLKGDLAPLTAELFLTRLCSNKKEVCVFGRARRQSTGG